MLTPRHQPEQTRLLRWDSRPASPGAGQGGSAGGTGPALPLEVRRLALLLQDLQLGSRPAWWLWFEIPGEPVPKGRPRAFVNAKTGKLGFYSPKDTRDAERAIGERFRHELVRRSVELPLEGPLTLVTLFFRSTRRIVDDDNLRKLVMDAATRAHVWGDDDQVTGGAQIIALDRERPRTLVALAPHDSTLVRASRRGRMRRPRPEGQGPV